jgi:hypothetical protein
MDNWKRKCKRMDELRKDSAWQTLLMISFECSLASSCAGQDRRINTIKKERAQTLPSPLWKDPVG